MYFPLLAFPLALGVLVSAQSFNDIPACARQCIYEAVAVVTPCSQDEEKCICYNRYTITNRALPCILDDCGERVAFDEVLPKFEAACQDYDYWSGDI